MIRDCITKISIMLALLLACSISASAEQLEKVDPESIPVPSRKEIRLRPSPLGYLPKMKISSLTAAPSAPKYVFRFFAFGIYNTRSRHTDTDYVTSGLSVGGTKYPAIVKRMKGDLNNGIYEVNLDFPGFTVDPNTKVVYSYSIINAGHGDPNPGPKCNLDRDRPSARSDGRWRTVDIYY
jgi:hypothetical protein